MIHLKILNMIRILTYNKSYLFISYSHTLSTIQRIELLVYIKIHEPMNENTNAQAHTTDCLLSINIFFHVVFSRCRAFRADG